MYWLGLWTVINALFAILSCVYVVTELVYIVSAIATAVLLSFSVWFNFFADTAKAAGFLLAFSLVSLLCHIAGFVMAFYFCAYTPLDRPICDGGVPTWLATPWDSRWMVWSLLFGSPGLVCTIFTVLVSLQLLSTLRGLARGHVDLSSYDLALAHEHARNKRMSQAAWVICLLQMAFFVGEAIPALVLLTNSQRGDCHVFNYLVFPLTLGVPWLVQLSLFASLVHQQHTHAALGLTVTFVQFGLILAVFIPAVPFCFF
eukprot:TRINITY_DN1546_c0_g1_i1.p1 TRINITY_DN1546_c0_g1~~TRINITY_DN1546_c0_g1_i1.p1  ORF type:complete len:258 (-),score=77.57 TRINITY_DN1546_c0_g1_i1:47-820(-)